MPPLFCSKFEIHFQNHHAKTEQPARRGAISEMLRKMATFEVGEN
jgi:hypothetical protein